MVVDTSAIVAILFQEPEAERFVETIEMAPTRLISTATQLEATFVVEGRKGVAGRGRVERFVMDGAFIAVPFTAAHLRIAAEAFRRYGRGRHAAGLNLGDCFAYALAKATGEPLLFKGNDFARTDVAAAV